MEKTSGLECNTFFPDLEKSGYEINKVSIMHYDAHSTDRICICMSDEHLVNDSSTSAGRNCNKQL